MNMMDASLRPGPPRPKARKTSPITSKYEDRAKEILRDAIAKRGVTIPELTERLAAIGVEMSSGGVANKISRGGFSSAFMLQCMEALDLELRAQDRR